MPKISINFADIQFDQHKVTTEENVPGNSLIANCLSYGYDQHASDLSKCNNLINKMNSELVIRSDDPCTEQDNLQCPFVRFQGANLTLTSNVIANTTYICNDKTWIAMNGDYSDGEMNCINNEANLRSADFNGSSYFSCDKEKDQSCIDVEDHYLPDISDHKFISDDSETNVLNCEILEPIFSNSMGEILTPFNFKWDADSESDVDSVS